jgi:hypothetical protein
LAEEDKEKTAFTTRTGLYEWNMLPMGLTNAPPTFQRDMDFLLSGLKWECCLVYLDDIIIYSPNFEQHLLDLRKVFDRLRDANMLVKLSKCQFARTEVSYLGHIVGNGQVRMDPMKVKAMVDGHEPRNKRELQRFLGLTTHYRRFIHHYADICEPLSRLTGIRYNGSGVLNNAKLFKL